MPRHNFQELSCLADLQFSNMSPWSLKLERVDWFFSKIRPNGFAYVCLRPCSNLSRHYMMVRKVRIQQGQQSGQKTRPLLFGKMFFYFSAAWQGDIVKESDLEQCELPFKRFEFLVNNWSSGYVWKWHAHIDIMIYIYIYIIMYIYIHVYICVCVCACALPNCQFKGKTVANWVTSGFKGALFSDKSKLMCDWKISSATIIDWLFTYMIYILCHSITLLHSKEIIEPPINPAPGSSLQESRISS